MARPKMQPRNGRKSRYEIFSEAVEDLERALARLQEIDLRRCPPQLRPDHRAARQAIEAAIKHSKQVAEGELDILNDRSQQPPEPVVVDSP
jgi:hypothetical protein